MSDATKRFIVTEQQDLAYYEDFLREETLEGHLCVYTSLRNSDGEQVSMRGPRGWAWSWGDKWSVAPTDSVFAVRAFVTLEEAVFWCLFGEEPESGEPGFWA